MTDPTGRPAEEPVPEVAGPADVGKRPAPSHTSPRRTRRAGRGADARPAASPASPESPLGAAGVPPGFSGPHPARPAPLVIARLHLRMGQLQLARAELEALAGRDALDEEALVDLAEARWRTGDLAGANEAATALLARGTDGAFALLIAAEFVAAQGRPGEARRLAARALVLTDGPLDAVFAGMPRSLIWPKDAPAPADTAASPGPAAVPGEGMTVAPVDHGRGDRARRAAAAGDLGTPASTAAAEAYAGGRAALAGGDVGGAALRLGVALRLDPGFAEGVLEAVGAWERDPALALVAGDALRLLGREAEAFDAFELARGRG